jgi:hypothetical protein
LQVGEGRADAPVGTTLAMIEQATKVLNSVHKRMHQAQSEEFALLIECFRENPKAFWQRNRKPALQWDEEVFRRALDVVDVVPQADPNTASHSQRVMKIMALKQLQAGNPGLYDAVAVDRAALRAIGWSNPEQFMLPPEKQSQPTPELLKGMDDSKIAHQKADADTLRAQAAMIKAQDGNPAPAGPQAPQADPLREQELQLKAAQLEASTRRDALNDVNRDKDREADERLENQRVEMARMKLEADHRHDHEMADKQLSHDQLQSILKLAATIKDKKQ